MFITKHVIRASFALSLLAVFGSCATSKREAALSSAVTSSSHALTHLPTIDDGRPSDFPGLHNVVAYEKNFYSGSVPEGEEGFNTLAAMGITTIISVDGAAPDIEAARALGMRYIHLPIGYNGFDETRKLELTRATRDALEQGPVYIHCHHGKHRSAGAAGAVVVSLGWATPEEMIARMKVSGTSPSYKGLYACTANAQPIAMSEIDSIAADFPEVFMPVGMVKSMVEIDEINEHLKAIEKAQWKVPEDHPDLVPVAEAGRMADIFRVLGESDSARRKPAEFLEMLAEHAANAQQLEDLLLEGADAATLSAQFALVQADCKACHVKYRD